MTRRQTHFCVYAFLSILKNSVVFKFTRQPRLMRLTVSVLYSSEQQAFSISLLLLFFRLVILSTCVDREEQIHMSKYNKADDPMEIKPQWEHK